MQRADLADARYQNSNPVRSIFSAHRVQRFNKYSTDGAYLRTAAVEIELGPYMMDQSREACATFNVQISTQLAGARCPLAVHIASSTVRPYCHCPSRSAISVSCS